MERALLAKAIRPATMGWFECSKNLFYVHVGALDLETGVVFLGKQSKQ